MGGCGEGGSGFLGWHEEESDPCFMISKIFSIKQISPK